ncbi:MAG: glycosyltransferase, partial [Gemmatimonadota bacterium]
MSHLEQILLKVPRGLTTPRSREESRDGSAVRVGPAESFRNQDIRWRPITRRTVTRAISALKVYETDRLWAHAALQMARRLLASGQYNAVVSCGPPNMVHTAARVAALEAGLPFVMDLRDPWSLQERLPEAIASPIWLMLARFHERRAVSAANLVVMNTDVARDRMRALYPGKAADILTVMNGYDEEPLPPPTESGAFVVAYAGAIYLDRSPTSLFRAAARVVREKQLSADEFRIELMGSVHNFNGVPIAEIAARE